ncbi:MAG: signal peptidase I [bacterium]|nr:signal peptidase I [bacterium]MDD6225093.1 signal peptidase I [bacterium]
MDDEKNTLLSDSTVKQDEEEQNNTMNSQVEVNSSGAVACIYDWVHCLLIAVIAVVIILTFFFRMVNVDGESMLETLQNGDKVIVSELFYTPNDGDIVVISHGQKYKDPIIKRVIATEGQTLDINFETGEVVVDGVVLQEDYIIGETIKGDTAIPSVIPEGKVFVMGDNRTKSLDSRYENIGLIDKSDIIGKAQFVAFPFNHFGGLY